MKKKLTFLNYRSCARHVFRDLLMKKTFMMFAVVLFFAAAMSSCENPNWRIKNKGDERTVNCSSDFRSDEPYSFQRCLVYCTKNVISFDFYFKGTKNNFPDDLRFILRFDNGRSLDFGFTNVDEFLAPYQDKDDAMHDVFCGKISVPAEKFNDVFDNKIGVFYNSEDCSTAYIANYGVCDRLIDAMKNSRSFTLYCPELNEEWVFPKYYKK